METLLPLVYDELRQMATHKLARERPGHTLQATALVHEACGSVIVLLYPARPYTLPLLFVWVGSGALMLYRDAYARAIYGLIPTRAYVPEAAS